MSEVLDSEPRTPSEEPGESPAHRPRTRRKKRSEAPPEPSSIPADGGPSGVDTPEVSDEPVECQSEAERARSLVDPVDAQAADEPSDESNSDSGLHLVVDHIEDDGLDEAGDREQPGAPDGAVESTPVEVSPERIVEAILFSSDSPLPPAKIVSILGVGSARDVRHHVEMLNQRYKDAGSSFRIEKLAGGYQMLTLPEFNPWIKRLKQSRQDSRLSQAALETLAVVAYKQPVVRAEIEAVRGVAAGEMLNRLRELGLVKIVGRAEDVGRPLLYGTTRRFLDVFGLGSLEDLPAVEELKAPE